MSNTTHQLKDKVKAAYQLDDLLGKSRRLMGDWGKHCATLAKLADVSPIRGTGTQGA